MNIKTDKHKADDRDEAARVNSSIMAIINLRSTCIRSVDSTFDYLCYE